MIKQSVKKITLYSVIISFLYGRTYFAYSSEIENISHASHQYTSYAEFVNSACLPCHYRNIPNGTDLYKLIPNPSETELKKFLAPILKDGNMPPNEVYRKILYDKFLQIK